LDRQADAARLNVPDWLWQRWRSHYGADVAQRIAEAHLQEPSLDLSSKGDPSIWAERFDGKLLSTGSVRIPLHGRIDALPGYDEGTWWVQDAAAALPARLLGDVFGVEVADLCAAPGGKTAQLAAAGARVVAVDSSRRRLGIARRNLDRLKLDAELVEQDVRAWNPGRLFTKIMLDAPCLATGTIRRHPDLPYLKSEGDLASLIALQQALLGRTIALLAPGGTLVYCTCSLEPEEGEHQIGAALNANSDLIVDPVRPGEAGITAEWITAEGYLRTLPFHSPGPGPNVAGMDGFFAARLVRKVGSEQDGRS
jgi:16S rRNA (cytosine967-C5)-methyltransferase